MTRPLKKCRVGTQANRNTPDEFEILSGEDILQAPWEGYLF